MADQNIKNVQTYLNSMYGLGLSVSCYTGSVIKVIVYPLY